MLPYVAPASGSRVRRRSGRRTRRRLHRVRAGHTRSSRTGSPRMVAGARRAVAATRSRARPGRTRTLIYAYSRRGGAEPYGDAYPAHLHIDLLPELQGQGLGQTTDRHAGAALFATGAWPDCTWSRPPRTRAPSRSIRVSGFIPLPVACGVQAFGMHVASDDPAPARPGVASEDGRSHRTDRTRSGFARRCRAHAGVAPRGPRARRDRVPRRAAGAPAAECRLPGAGARPRCRDGSPRSTGASRVEVVEGDAADGSRSAKRCATSTCSTTSSTRWAPGKGSKTADRAAATTVARRRPRHPSGASCISADCIRDDAQLSPHLRSRVEVGQDPPR